MVEVPRLPLHDDVTCFVKPIEINKGRAEMKVKMRFIRIRVQANACFGCRLLVFADTLISNCQTVMSQPVIWVEPRNQLIRFFLFVEISGGPKVIDLIDMQLFKFSYVTA